MEHTRLVSLRLPLDLIAAIEGQARASGDTPGALARRLLQQALPAAPARIATETPTDTSQATRFQTALAEAIGWIDLQIRLRRDGLVLRLRDGVLCLHAWPSNRFLMPVNAMGVTLETLVLRFRAPFPGAIRTPAPTHAARPEPAPTPGVAEPCVAPPEDAIAADPPPMFISHRLAPAPQDHTPLDHTWRAA